MTDAADGPVAGPEETGRLLFRYVTGEEWQEHRAVMAVFAGTFFSEFTPEEVQTRVAHSPVMDAGTVAERLESLRRWGNLTVSSATGSPSSLADYYKRRNRYLITRAGQEVHDAVEGVLTRVDEVRDISTGRLRALLDALRGMAAVDVATCDPRRLADLVGAVFEPHQAFTSEITQFFAAVNQWRSRYDLTAEEFSFFAQVLVGYVGDRLDEIERASRPIAAALIALAPAVPTIVERADLGGLAAQVQEAGLQASVTVTRSAGSSVRDWEHLTGWFVGRAGRPSRMDQLRREAVAAIRALTLNLTRLSRVGLGGSSRRADFLGLARILEAAPDDEAPRLVNAAFGVYPAAHLGVPAADAADPVTNATSWWDAPTAPVPVSLRERGDTGGRGRASPITDRSAAQRLVRRRREQEREALRRVDAELLAHDPIDGSRVSVAALTRFEQLVAKVLTRMPVRAERWEHADGAVACLLERTPDRATAVSSPEGTLQLLDLRVSLRPAEAPPVEP